MRRFSDIELEIEPSREATLRAADAIRAFDSSDGWKLIVRRMEKHAARATESALGGHVSMMSITDCAYTAGVRATVKEVYRAFEEILRESERISKDL